MSYKIILIVALSLLLAGNIVWASPDTVIITPKELEGPIGGKVNPAEVFVQKVTLTQVTNLKNIEIVDDNGIAIKEFPKQEFKAMVRTKDTKENLGMINLKPYKLSDSIPISMNQKGEFLFYQKPKAGDTGGGRVFNSLSSAEEGTIYFRRNGKTPNSRPLSVPIGEIEQGAFKYEDYVEVTNKTISLKRGGK